MPQLILEFSSNIIEKNDFTDLFQECHAALSQMLPTNIMDCKSRAIEYNNYFIGDMNKNNAFIHITLKVMPGRTTQILENVAAAIMQILKKHFAKSLHELKLQITL